MRRRQLFSSVPAVVVVPTALFALPETATAQSLTPEAWWTRVRERLTEKYFAQVTESEMKVHLEISLSSRNSVLCEDDCECATNLDELCLMGDPWADCVAWSVVMLTSLRLNHVWAPRSEGVYDFIGLGDNAELLAIYAEAGAQLDLLPLQRPWHDSQREVASAGG